MNKKRVIALGLLVLAAVIGVYWWASGASVWTLTEVPVEVKDEMFQMSTTEWKEEFRLGLEYALPAVGLLLAVAGVLLWLARREKRRAIAAGKNA